MAGIVRIFALGAALAAAAPAAAQQQPSREPSEIVVTGNRELENEVRDFVGALADAPTRGQIGRFEWAVCPAAAGLSAGQRAEIVARMRAVAEAAGLRVGGEDCRPNVIVAVTPDKRRFIEALDRRGLGYFSGLPNREVRRLARSPGPAAAWHLDGPDIDADGQELPSGQGIPVNRSLRPPSRITPPVHPQFAAAIVVVEEGALDGLTTVQLADYAAMRAYARTDPAQLGRTAAPTILRVLDAPMGSAVPVTLTRWDLAFLRAVYGGPPNLYAGADRVEIRRRLLEELERAEAEAE